MKVKNGYIFYELLICFIIITSLLYTLVIPMHRILFDIENKQLTDKMKHTLALNIVLVEDGTSLTSDSSYHLFQEGDNLCITWWDLNNENRTYCEKIWT